MNLGERLREERERLGYSQPAFAAVADAKKHAQINWEKGVAYPNAAALEAWAKIGLDVLYVVTGQPNQSVLDAGLALEEETLLDSYRRCSRNARIKLIQTAALLAAGINAGKPDAPIKQPSVKVSSKRGHAAGRDLIIKQEEK